ncbi:50S ribosomal protein L11 methyltransferase [Lapidilactobacillus wuchangensis]|uniref:50S ribosomal protein L11 methyltransferase n=1 Tax=Lapidilactobacillus wuchangensis TaxID=2486001 RepID=UPI000F7B851C|nr:50S ribosomal protein L11 methyltransferase [Lapidilactobacillus wuchangensis]
MDWWQVRVDCTNDQVEIIANVFEDLGTGGVQIADQETTDFQLAAGWQAVIAYLPASRDLANFMTALRQQLAKLATAGLLKSDLPIATKDINEADWQTSWQDFYQPIQLSRYLTIVPQWQKYQPASATEQVVYLNPGKSFGTGAHTTSQLAAAALELTLRPHMAVFDVGTGSGILSLLAWKLGAGRIVATEIDQPSLTYTRDNLAFNQADKAIELHQGSLLEPVRAQANLIVANMLPEALLPLIPQLDAHLLPQGQIIYTGIIAEQAEKMKQALVAAGFAITLTISQNHWYCFRAQRQSEVAD